MPIRDLHLWSMWVSGLEVLRLVHSGVWCTHTVMSGLGSRAPGACAQSEQFEERELAMYRAMALFRSLLTPLPCTVEDAARMSHDDIVEFYRVRG